MNALKLFQPSESERVAQLETYFKDNALALANAVEKARNATSNDDIVIERVDIADLEDDNCFLVMTVTRPGTPFPFTDNNPIAVKPASVNEAPQR